VGVGDYADDHLQAHLDAGMGVEVVSQGVTEEVEAEDGEGHCEGREEHEVG